MRQPTDDLTDLRDGCTRDLCRDLDRTDPLMAMWLAEIRTLLALCNAEIARRQSDP